MNNQNMRIISRPPIIEFGKKHPLAVIGLNDWYKKTKRAEWRDFGEVKQTFNSCDYIGCDRYVFNIGGNKDRLVAMINFRKGTLYVRGVLTHAQYDEHGRKGTLITL
ncbi:type II toxin-antitoxin system HigB family toxin [Chitinophaga sp.]|uniref:type II toxin-antitoxin system HigB family toxin n=1 Tax=Chitinophaga sp. TaxID=1869181 RepID=UPI0031CFBF1E